MNPAPRVPLTSIDVNPEKALELIGAALSKGQLAQGPLTERFEAEFAEFIGADHAVAVANGTVAITAALAAAGVGPGDQVITSPFTFAGTLNAIVALGAVARLVDIADDFCLDADAAASAVGSRTRALLPVHLYGQCADMDPIMALAQSHSLPVVEDAAQAHGASYWGRPAGTFGTGCFSFYATKNITSAEGGMITTADEVTAERLRIFRNQGMRGRYEHVGFGINGRLSDVHAAIALAQMTELPERNRKRATNAEVLNAGLAGIDGVIVPVPAAGRVSAWHHYTIRVTGEARLSRDELSVALDGDGIGNGLYYPRLAHDYPCFSGSSFIVAEDVPKARRFSAEILSLPVHPALTEGDLDAIITSVRRHLT